MTPNPEIRNQFRLATPKEEQGAGRGQAPRDDEFSKNRAGCERHRLRRIPDDKAAADRVVDLSRRVALRCLRVFEESLARERAQRRLFQEQLRRTRQVQRSRVVVRVRPYFSAVQHVPTFALLEMPEAQDHRRSSRSRAWREGQIVGRT